MSEAPSEVDQASEGRVGQQWLRKPGMIGPLKANWVSEG